MTSRFMRNTYSAHLHSIIFPALRASLSALCHSRDDLPLATRRRVYTPNTAARTTSTIAAYIFLPVHLPDQNCLFHPFLNVR